MSTQEGWPARITRSVAGEIRRRRTALGWSAQELAGRCAELGLDIPRATIADLENGRRAHISVAELLLLAAALGMAPLELVVPLGDGTTERTEILPGRETGAWDAAKWVSGEDLFPGDLGGPEMPFRATDPALYRLHDRYEDDEFTAATAAGRAAMRATSARNEAERAALADQAHAWDEAMRRARAALLGVRETMRGRGLVLPGDDPLTGEQDP
jgi:transcriptional regulator with XRE-family HTH domain